MSKIHKKRIADRNFKDQLDDLFMLIEKKLRRHSTDLFKKPSVNKDEKYEKFHK